MTHPPLLSIDPSSTRTGYAVMTSPDDAGLVEAGALRGKGGDPYTRIDSIVADVMELIDEHRPALAVIETTSGKTARRMKRNASGLPIYGAAVGAIRQVLIEQMGKANVVGVLENDWTNGVPKTKRLAWLRYTSEKYAATEDTGGDIGDAIALGRWWLTANALRKETA